MPEKAFVCSLMFDSLFWLFGCQLDTFKLIFQNSSFYKYQKAILIHSA